MNFFLNTVARLSFVIKFSVDIGDYQDYFSFNGNDAAAHLSRSNNTVSLVLMLDDAFELYQTSNVSDSFTFTWGGYQINNQNMELSKSSGRINHTEYNSYSFFATEMEIETDRVELECRKPYIYNNSEMNYKLLAFIVFMIGLSLRSDEAVRRMRIIYKSIYGCDTNTLNTREFDNIREEIV